MTLDIDAMGRPVAVAYQRRHRPADETFTATFAGESTFGGVTVPAKVRGGWAGKEFIRYRIDGALFR
ncbi:hypothetical protein OIE66_17600 [Nonomuraea sp. NBC_01738]|nr:hypothetical protein OIE66_17600 [Nonomuraea sp. NBC_01738]